MAKAKAEKDPFSSEIVCRNEQERISEEIEKFLTFRLKNSQDRRKNPRVPVCFPVTYLLHDGKKWKMSEQIIQALNLSADGIKGVSTEKIPVKSFLFVRFKFRDRLLIRIAAQIKWGEYFEGLWFMGLAFGDLKPEHKRALIDFATAERAEWFSRITKLTGKDRRMYFRVGVEARTHFSVYSDSHVGHWDYQPERLALLNVSGDGASVRYEKELLKGSLVSFNFPFGENAFPVIAKVVWCQARPDGQFLAGLQFANLQEEHREAIVKFVFQEQQRIAKSAHKV